ncbi:MAG: 50S ribosomal protein L11 methyltransferase [Oscillospiraceae bacterium]|nr:50S ribosomal protein L11 methyltransferase [Oscillospiraceae bacterium]
MKYTKITIVTADENIELLTSHLSDLGADGFEIGGGSELRELVQSTDPDLIDDELANAALNESITVTVYIPENGQGQEIVFQIKAYLEEQGLEYTIGAVCEEDWENNWKQYFKPIKIGSRLVIKPLWEEYAESSSGNNGRIILEIEPSGAFGTGQHATTVMCLELLEKRVRVSERVLDIGCGSGILSAAAMLLGAKSVTSVDICETAVRVTGETLRLNNIADYSLHCGNLIGSEGACLLEKIGTGFDITVANITADVITAMAEIFPVFTEKTLILSGIIAHRLGDVLKAIEPHFTVSETRESEGWNALLCVRK